MSMHTRMREMTIRRLGVGRGGQGSLLKMTVKGTGVFDPVTGKVNRTPDTEELGSAVRVNYSDRNYKDETIVYGDFQLYISPVLLSGLDCPVPVPQQRMEFGGKSVTVIRVDPFNDNAELTCGWKVQVRYG